MAMGRNGTGARRVASRETARIKRKLKNQSDFDVQRSDETSGVAIDATSGDMKFTVPVDQVWSAHQLDVECGPRDEVLVKYSDEETNNEITLPKLYGYEMPLGFKKTATDTGLKLWEDRSLTVNVVRRHQGALKPRSVLHFIKNYRRGA